MAELKVIRTDGTADELISKSETPCVHLFLTFINNERITGNHEIGDVLLNEDSETRFALLVKEYASDKVIQPALRVALINLLKHITIINESLADTVDTIVISKHEFKYNREEHIFIATFRELMMTYFENKINNDINIVICDY